MRLLSRIAQEMGLRGALLTGAGAVALAVCLLALYQLGGEPAGTAPLTRDTHVTQVVPATGPEGFGVEPFCADPETQVKALVNPDGSVTYQLLRVKDGVSEAVVWTGGDNPIATHYYYDASNVQQAGPAFLTKQARQCIEGGAK